MLPVVERSRAISSRLPRRPGRGVHTLMAGGAGTAEALATAGDESGDAPVPAPFVAFGAAW